MHMPRFFTRAMLACALLLSLAGTCFAAQEESAYCFSALDFPGASGIVITAVPSQAQGVLRCGSRSIRAGDVLSQDMLDSLRFCAAAEEQSSVSLSYLPVSDGGVGLEQTLTLQVFGRKKGNEPPTAAGAEIETYKNIAFTGKLEASDPEGGALSYTVTAEPKRGSVRIEADGSFTYTPDKNKVGKDSFSYTVTDADGNTSAPATVNIRIQKPSDKATFADMAGREGEYYAMWAKDQGLLSGESVAGTLCFNPDKPVSRGEFVVMVMRLFDLDTSQAQLTSSFADARDIPDWMQPYLASAISAGIVSGIASEEGMVFRAASAITEAEAAVILQNLLQFPTGMAEADPAVETWAQPAAGALAAAGVGSLSCSAEPLSRLSCAQLLCEAYKAADAGRYGLLSWAAEE